MMSHTENLALEGKPNCCGLCVKQEKRKKSNILPNGLVEGDEEEEDSGHGGPELQRTGR